MGFAPTGKRRLSRRTPDAAITTVTLEDKGDKTLLVLRERYPSKQALDEGRGAEAGLPEQFEQLDDLLATLVASKA